MINADPIWFQDHPRRQTRIRVPNTGEFDWAWRLLGPHDEARRRVLIWRVPKNDPGRAAVPDGLMRISFVLNDGETLANDDATLMPVLADLMQGASGAEAEGGLKVTGAASG